MNVRQLLVISLGLNAMGSGLVTALLLKRPVPAAPTMTAPAAESPRPAGEARAVPAPAPAAVPAVITGRLIADH